MCWVRCASEQIAALLLEQWRMPLEVISAIRQQQTPNTRAPGGGTRSCCTQVRARCAQQGIGDARVSPFPTHLLDALGLNLETADGSSRKICLRAWMTSRHLADEPLRCSTPACWRAAPPACRCHRALCAKRRKLASISEPGSSTPASPVVMVLTTSARWSSSLKRWPPPDSGYEPARALSLRHYPTRQ